MLHALSIYRKLLSKGNKYKCWCFKFIAIPDPFIVCEHADRIFICFTEEVDFDLVHRFCLLGYQSDLASLSSR